MILYWLATCIGKWKNDWVWPFIQAAAKDIQELEEEPRKPIQAKQQQEQEVVCSTGPESCCFGPITTIVSQMRQDDSDNLQKSLEVSRVDYS
jgi:hypothetical protein